MGMKKRFSDLFPIPHFLAVPAVGVAVSDDSIRFVEFVYQKGLLRLKSFGEKSLPPGIVESGVIKKSEEFVKELAGFREKHGLNYVSVSLPEEQAYLFELRLPKMKFSEVRDAVELQLEEYVPLPPAEVIFDYDFLPETNTKSGEMNLNVAVLPKLIVEEYASAFAKSGFSPVAFEIEGQAAARAVIPKGDAGTHILVSINGSHTCLCIASEGVVRFSSTINIGGDLFISVVQKERNVSREEAVRILNEQGIGWTDKSSGLFTLLLPSLSALKDEIGKHYLYWSSHNNGGGATTLCGSFAHFPGLADYLSYGLENEVKYANPWVNVMSFEEEIPPMTYEESFSYIPAIGLALRNLDENKKTIVSL
jgi:type IV pilus assembly protein PilM